MTCDSFQIKYILCGWRIYAFVVLRCLNDERGNAYIEHIIDDAEISCNISYQFSSCFCALFSSRYFVFKKEKRFCIVFVNLTLELMKA